MTDLDCLMSSQVDVGQYVGLWIAVVGGKVVASGTSAREVYDKALRTCPGEEPFVAKVPKEKVMLL